MTAVLASGFGLVESPRWHDGTLWFADWVAGEIRVLEADGRTNVVLAHESMPLCFDFLPDGTMLLVSNAAKALLRLTTEGTLKRHADLRPLSALGANDIVVDGRGNAYVNSNDAEFGTSTPPDGPATGCVYLVSADNRTLIVAESYRHRLTAFEVLETVEFDRGAFACVLGGDDGRTLLTVGASWPGMDQLTGNAHWHGTVWSSPAPAPRAGWPDN